MPPTIFKAYDIRGIYPDELNEVAVERIGRAAASFFKSESIAVGCDQRASSPSLKAAFIKGVTDSGVHVVDIGLTTTPCAYFASHHLKIPVAMITASHNPLEYNGIKFCGPQAAPIGRETGLESIRDLARSNNDSTQIKKGKVDKNPITRAYHKFLISQFQVTQSFKVAIDTASAMGIEDLPLWKNLRHIDLVGVLYDSYKTPCPHEANPMKTETLAELGETVKSSGAAIGIGYDGDADRIGIVDETGTPLRADLLAGLLAPLMLKKYPESKILVDIRSSRAVSDAIREHGGTPVYSPVGHVKIKKLMQETGAVFAGELSGHFYYHTPYIAEMGPLPVFHLLEVMEYQKKPLSKIIGLLAQYAHSGERNFHVEDADVIITKIREVYKDGIANDLDGVRIDYPNWWFSVRSSNTESLLRLNVESKTLSETEEHVAELADLFASFGGAPAKPVAHSR